MWGDTEAARKVDIIISNGSIEDEQGFCAV
jgi:hypothetical protein